MALSDAVVGFHTSSGGGGGELSVYDTQATAAVIATKAYWRPSTLPTGEDRRKLDAVEDFIARQQQGTGSTGSGVVVKIIGSGTTNGIRIAKLGTDGEIADMSALSVSP